jgi:hypothetical protein
MRGKQGFGWADLLALIISGVAAAVAPLQVFLLAYAVLGPFHYLTEIAWLQKKDFYFREGLVSPRWYAALAGVLALISVSDYIFRRGLGLWGIGLLLLLSLSVWVSNVYVLAALAVAAVAVKWLSPSLVIFLGVITPTLLHVFVFTEIFMISGALRNKTQGVAKWLNPALVMAIPVALILLTTHYTAPGAFWVRSETLSFGPLHQYIAGHLHHTMRLDANMLADSTVAAILRVSAFAYLFHYLNWFTKVELLSWHRISRNGWFVMGTLYAISLSFYAWSFAAGFLVSNFLSLLHVLLEFPLNWQAIRLVAFGWRERRPLVQAVAVQSAA